MEEKARWTRVATRARRPRHTVLWRVKTEKGAIEKRIYVRVCLFRSNRLNPRWLADSYATRQGHMLVQKIFRWEGRVRRDRGRHIPWEEGCTTKCFLSSKDKVFLAGV